MLGARRAPCLIAMLVTILCIVVYEHYAKRLPPLHADETGHALPAARMAIDLRRGDVGSFVADTQRELLWPFVHPWYLAAFFLMFGISTEVARASSLFAYGASIVVAFVLARELLHRFSSDKTSTDGWIGMLTATLMIVNVDMWTVSSTVMIEPLGILATLSCLLSHACALRRRSTAGCFATGLLAALTFLTKYNYGIPLIGALVLCLVARRGEAWPGRRAQLLLLIGIAVPVFAWLAYPFPAKLQWLYDASVNRDEGLSGLRSVFFYPMSMAKIVSWPVTALLLAAPLLALRRADDLRLRQPILFALLGLAMLTIHPNKQVRYSCTIVPVLYLLGELELARIADSRVAPRRTRALIWTAAAALLALLLEPSSAMRDDLQSQQPRRAASAIIAFIASALQPQHQALILGSTGLLPHLVVKWEIIARRGDADAVVDTLVFPGDESSILRHRRGYPVEMTPEYERVLDETLRAGRYDRIVALAVADGSTFAPAWLSRWDAWAQNYVLLMERQTLYPLVSERVFPEAGVDVRVYAKR